MLLSRALRTTSLTHLSFVIALTCAATNPARANPEDGVVSSGSATISSSGKKLDVHQQSDRVVIDWRSFNIEVDEHTHFYQPSSGSVALNRVNSVDPSHILGKLSANGNVILINPNGVLFGAGSQIDVNGIVATTADITNENFMAGRLHFDKPGNPNAAIINEGRITAKEAGLVGIVAPNVINTGVITAKLGRIHLASGDTATVDLYGDGLMEVAVSDDVKSQIVVNEGVLAAEGGHIAMTAAAGKDIVNNLVVVKGELKAPAVGIKNGKISIFAEGSNAVKKNVSADKGKKQGSSGVIVQALLDTSGLKDGERGGEISVSGDEIAILNGTIMNASGHTGSSGTTDGKKISDVREGSAGGDIRIGGDYLGQGDTATAKNLFVDTYTLFYNDALDSGDAGRTIFWSDNDTIFKGNVYARGGVEGGNGGFLETSGHNNLVAQGWADLTAINGKKGTYFLDPTNIKISGNFTPDDINGLQLWLDATTLSSLGNGASVSTWENIAPVNADATTVGNNPTYLSTAFGGRGGVSFTNTSYLRTGGMPIQSVFTVARSNNAVFGDYEGILGGDISNPGNGHILNAWAGSTNLYAGASGAHYSARQNSLSVTNGTFTGIDAASGWIGSFIGPSALTNTETWIGRISGGNRGWNGQIGEIIAYSTDIGVEDRALVEQYQSLKWGVTLDPFAGAGTEAVEAMDATNGYSGFTTRYLEYLSQTADISLQASNDITFDLRGDTLALQADRNLTLTAGNDIKTTNDSSGMIETTRTASGGNITMTAVRDIDLRNISLKTNNGNIDLNAGRDVSTSTAINTGTGSLDVDGQNISVYGGGVAGMPSLVGYYRFDEGTGTVLTDYSGNNNHGTVNGAVWAGTGNPVSTGTAGSLSFDGSNDYVTIADSNSLDLTNGFTISVWMKSNGAQINNYLLGKQNAGGSDNVYSVVYGYAANQVQFYASGNTYGYPGGNSNIGVADTGWHQVSYTYDGTKFDSYKDGILVNSVTMTSNLAASTGALLIGAFNTSAGHTFNGLIDDVRIYNKGLSSGDIARLAAPASWQTGVTNMNATNNISFDLKGDIINAASLSMTAGNNISSPGLGEIRSAGHATLTAGNDLTFAHDFDINATGSGNVMLRSGNSILYTGSGDITTQGGNITLISDYHATTPNNIGAIYLGSGTTLTSNNGNIVLGGGTDGTGYAYGTSANGSGIEINAATISSGTGAVTMHGNGYTGGSVPNEHGIWIQGNSAINSTSGNMSFYGRGGVGTTSGHDGWGNIGYYLLGSNVVSNTGNLLVNGTSGTGNLTWNVGGVVYTGSSMRTAGNGTINFSGTNNTALSSSQLGIWLGSGNGYLQSENGDITVSGTAARATVDSYGAYLYGSVNGLRTTGSGNISLTGSADTASHDIYYGQAFGFGSGTATGNIAINANKMSVVATPTITTTGNVTFVPRTAGTTVGVAGGAGTLGVTNGILDNITASMVTIGRADGSGLMTVGARDWSAENYNLRLLNGSTGIDFASGAMTMGGRTLLAQTTSGGIQLLNGSSIVSTAAGNAITLASGAGFINNSGSATPMTVTGGGRWLIYTANHTGNTLNSMGYDFRRFSCTYGGTCPTLGTGNGMLHVNTPLLTLTPDAATVTYGDTVPAFAYALSGYLDSDAGVDVRSGTAGTFTTPYTQGNNAGTYDITSAVGTLSSAMGYGFTTATRSNGLTVGKKTLTAAVQNQSATYGDAIPTLSKSNTGHITYTGLYSSDTGADLDTVTFSYGGYAQGSNSNTYTLGLSAFTDNNYTMSLPAGVTTGTLNVGKKALTATISNQNVTFGDAAPTLSKSSISHITYGGLYGSDTGADLDTVAFSFGGYSIGSNVGNYTLSLASFSDNNYSITLPADVTTGTMAIGKASLLITADDASRLEGDPNPSFTAFYTGLLAGNTSSVVSGLNFTTPANLASAVGNYAITPGGATATNYNISYSDGNLSILAQAYVPPPPTTSVVIPHTVMYTSQVPAEMLTSATSVIGASSAQGNTSYTDDKKPLNEEINAIAANADGKSSLSNLLSGLLEIDPELAKILRF